MRIKERQTPTLKHYLTPFFNFFLRKKTRILFFLIAILVLLVIGLVAGLILAGFFGPLSNPSTEARTLANKIGIFPVAKGLFGVYKTTTHPVQYVQGKFSKPKQLYLDVSFENYQKLATKRLEAIARDALFPTDEDYVSAKLRHEGEEYKVKIRLKGDRPDHWADARKWSFRVVLKDDKTLFGMKKFSLQHPKTRNYLNEWYLHKFLSYNGLIALRYDFVEVFVNGEKLGVYALEEHFGKQLIENNERREGPLFRFNDYLCWYKRHLLGCDEIYTASSIEPYQANQIKENALLLEEFTKGKELLEAFREGNLKTSEVFDTKQLATLFAVGDLLGYHHFLHYTNIRFYYNPLTGKIEPIGFDNQYIEELKGSYALLGAGKNVGEKQTNITWIETFFYDEEFYLEYLKALQKTNDVKLLDTFFVETEDEAKKHLNVLYKDYPWYVFEHEKKLYKNQEYIQTLLHPLQTVQAYSVGGAKNELLLLIGNIHPLPVEVLGIKYKGKFVKSTERVVLQPKKHLQPVAYESYAFNLPGEVIVSEVEVHSKILGMEEEQIILVPPWEHTTLKKDLVRMKPNLEKFSFLQVDEKKKIITVEKGTHKLTEIMILPKDYTFFVQPGTQLDLLNEARILSSSSLQLRGTNENKITITSSDNTGKGILVLEAEESLFEHVVIKKLRNPKMEAMSITGAITFYKSPFKMSAVSFSNIQAEDAINIVNSPFVLDTIKIQESSSDCLDSDFSKGSITNSAFISCGNDGLDFSGSVVIMKDVSVVEAGDKALSVGEESVLIVDEFFINKSFIGIASKDSSEVTLTAPTIQGVQYTYAAYQKKSEYGPATIEIIKGVEEYTTLIEKGSKLIYNEKTLEGKEKKVYEQLYEQ
tara:strand:- start:1732 stop:4350 length:2619 start_codon:yes stop_codon:yes gene_type:complete